MAVTTQSRTRFQSIEHFDAPDLDTPPARTLAAIRAQAPEFREWFRGTGRVDAFAARSLVTLPYPKRFGLWEACRLPIPYVWMTNRMFVMRWDENGTTRTLLAEPSDYELGVDTPFLMKTIERLPMPRDKALDTFFTRHRHVDEHLADLGIAREDVDYISFDHLHTQDVRRLIGTTAPAPDLGHPDEPVPAMFPNAKLIVQRTELDHVRAVHPFQERFHQAWTYADIREDNLLVVEGDLLVAPGIALLRTPGHTLGNHTLVVNTERGILTSSENGVAVECYAPQHSRLPGVAKWAKEWGYEVVMNYNTPEFASWQYNAMIKEKLIADPIPERPEFPQVVPSSELARHRLAPGIKPAYTHGELTIGTIAPSRAHA